MARILSIMKNEDESFAVSVTNYNWEDIDDLLRYEWNMTYSENKDKRTIEFTIPKGWNMSETLRAIREYC